MTGGVPPALAVALMAAATQWSIGASVGALAVVWYGAEAALTKAAGWHLSWRSVPAWIVRDLVLPVVWVAGWAGDRIEWRGTAMQVVNHHSAVSRA